MRRLAIDTSSVACTVAVQFDDLLVERHEEKPREHTRLLVPMIRETLQESRVEIGELDAIVLGNGPGSFIGMRIAASVSQGLAYGAGLNILPVSSLAAVAAEVLQTSTASFVAVAQDAHMDQVYLGLYERGALNLPQLVGDERLHGADRIDELDTQSPSTNVAAGHGWIRYPDLMAANAEKFARPPSVLYPRAKYLLQLSNAVAPVPPAAIVPADLRQKVAEKSIPNNS